MLARTTLLAALAAGPALAGDLSPVAATPAPVMAPTALAAAPARESWTGGYAGVQLSYGDARDEAGGGRSTGGFYGLTAGYRYDFGRLVVGGSVSYDRTDVTFPAGSDVDNLLRAGVQVGYDLGRYLPYATAGYAGASLRNDALDFDDEYDGSFIGAGIAYRVSRRLVLSGEVIRHDFDPDSDATLTTFGGTLAWKF